MIAKTAYFYKWDLEYVQSLPADEFMMAWNSITIIEAQEMIIKMKLSDFPMMNASDRKAFRKDLDRKAYPKSFKKTKHTVDTNQLASIIRK